MAPSILDSWAETRLTDALTLQAEVRNKELQALGVGVKVVCVGKKAQVYFRRRKDRFDVVGGWQLRTPI